VVKADRIADSCGYAVPEMELTQERDLLTRWAERKSSDELSAYRDERNAVSIDGLPALRLACYLLQLAHAIRAAQLRARADGRGQ